MNFYSKRLFFDRLGYGNPRKVLTAADSIKQKIVEAGEFEMYFGTEYTPETLARIDLKKPLFFMITAFDVYFTKDKSVGYIGFTDRGNNVFAMELYIYPQFRRKGYASEAVEAALEMLFGRGLRNCGDTHEIIAAKKVIAPVWAENETAKRFMENMGFECNEKNEYPQPCFSNDTPEISDRINYYMTKDHFERLEAQKRYVYDVEFAIFNDVFFVNQSQGYFSTEREAWNYCLTHPSRSFHIEKIRCMDSGQNLENLEDIEILYRHTFLFIYKASKWIIIKQPWNYSVISGARASGSLIIPNTSINSVEVIVEHPSDERKNAEEIARDIFSRYMAACGGEISEESAALFNRILENHWKNIDNSSGAAV